jgi:hypothetical protein
METFMIPLIDRDAHARLLHLRDEMIKGGDRNTGDVFVPIGPNPEDPTPAPFRILYVGRALQAGKHDPELDDYDRAVSWSKKVIRDRLIARDPPSPYWSFIREIVARSLRAIGHDPASVELDKIVAWSNLAKISDVRYNPYGRQLEAQSGICVELLKAEMALAKPTAIIVTAGDYAERQILSPVFGSERWVYDTADKKQNAAKSTPPNGIPVLWTNHPQNMLGEGNLEKSRAFCSAAIIDALR